MSKRVASFSLNSFVAPSIQEGNEWYKKVTYADAKSIIKDKMVASCENIVAIGFYLKHIKETRQYEEDGYATIWACAFSEFQLDQSATSRYIDICKKYSVNGDSPLLDDKYKNFSKGQLQEMLTIKDDNLLAEITPDMSVRKIREKKKIAKAGQGDEDCCKEDSNKVVEGEFREIIIKEEDNIIDIAEKQNTSEVDFVDFTKEETEIVEYKNIELIGIKGGYDIKEVDKLIIQYKKYYDLAIEKSEDVLEYVCILDALEILKDRLKHQA